MVFKRNTTVVVGAGASREFGMPLGSELAASISSEAGRLAKDGRSYSGPHEDLLQALLAYGGVGNLDAALGIVKTIATGVVTSTSIDNYLDRMKDNSELVAIGKVLIAHFILFAEGQSTLGPGDVARRGTARPIELSKATWLRTLSLRLFEDLPKTNLADLGTNLTIVNFNYDRCIERYLQEAIRIGYEVPESVAHELAMKIKILRPYGGLGPLPKDPILQGQNVVPFGRTWDRAESVRIAANLRTFTEQLDEGADVLRMIRDSLACSQQVLFLGFGFHRQNMRLLSVPPRNPSGPLANLRHLTRVYATGVGVSGEERQAVTSSIASTLSLADPAQVSLALDTGAVELLTLHGRNIQ